VAAAALDLVSLNPTTTSPGHTAPLVAATGVPSNKRVPAYHEAPPVASDTPLTEIARSLYSRPGALSSSSGAVTNRSRKIATQPERVLDAPGIVDDFYLNLIPWSVQNVVTVALAKDTYIRKQEPGEVVQVGEASWERTSPCWTFFYEDDFGCCGCSWVGGTDDLRTSYVAFPSGFTVLFSVSGYLMSSVFSILEAV
jgi:hypothetical protein